MGGKHRDLVFLDYDNSYSKWLEPYNYTEKPDPPKSKADLTPSYLKVNKLSPEEIKNIENRRIIEQSKF